LINLQKLVLINRLCFCSQSESTKTVELTGSCYFSSATVEKRWQWSMLLHLLYKFALSLSHYPIHLFVGTYLHCYTPVSRPYGCHYTNAFWLTDWTVCTVTDTVWCHSIEPRSHSYLHLLWQYLFESIHRSLSIWCHRYRFQQKLIASLLLWLITPTTVQNCKFPGYCYRTSDTATSSLLLFPDCFHHSLYMFNVAVTWLLNTNFR